MLNKIIAAGDNRRSRLHTEDDVFIGWKSALVEVPITAVQKMRNAIVGSRPIVPWWPLPAIREVNARLRPDMRAIEFGSGSSSIWIARRVGYLVCREHDRNWAEVTRRRLASCEVTNCEVQHCADTDYYRIESDQRFDFAVIDGEFRWKCIEAVWPHMNSGGIIYFDNSDSDKDAGSYNKFGVIGDRLAQKYIFDLEKDNKIKLQEFHGMINGEIFAGSGILITVL